MAEYSTSADQIVNPGESVTFDLAPSPCNRGFVRHRDGSGNFLLSGWMPSFGFHSGCQCSRNKSAQYSVNFSGNISVPTGGTAGEISLALALDGATLPDGVMIVTPAAVEEYFNVNAMSSVDIWRGCCETVTVRNISDQAIQVRAGASINFARPDLIVTY